MMAPFLQCALVVLVAVATAGNVQTSTASTSISQIRDTLRNLLRSIEDNGRDAETLFGKRQQWCDSALHNFEAASAAGTTKLSGMQSQLTETQAEVEEAKGTVQQVKVDIEMVQHTIKQTEDMLKEQQGASLMQTAGKKADPSVLTALADNKHLSLASLQEELEVTVPVLAQLQANVAETKQRISYHSESVSVTKDFLAALKDGCQGSADRADSQAAARVGETNSINVALQALNEIEGVKPESDADAQEDLNQAGAALSFVQVAEVTTDDLSDLFSADKVSSFYKAHAHAAVATGRRAQVRAVGKTAVAQALQPRIQTLLSQLKGAGSAATSTDQSAWCAKQRESGNMALKFAKDSVAQVTSEMTSHAAAESELSEELEKLNTLAAAVTDSAKTVLEQASKEQALIQSGRKDQVLATKILDQASTILKELGVDKTTKAVAGLTSAKKMLNAQVKAADGFMREAASKAKSIGEKALVLTKTQESEQHNLELARDDHSSQRLSGVANKQLYDADVDQAIAFVQKLEASCKGDAQQTAEQQRSVQVHALEDANKALDGKLVETKSVANSLRGADSSQAKAAPDFANMTPMERAAAEMGVSSD